MLEFAPADWNFSSSANLKYGFNIGIKVPDYPPNASPANFAIEFGYDKTDLSGRLYGGIVTAPKILALTNARIDYESNQENQKTTLTVQIETSGWLYPRVGRIRRSTRVGLMITTPKGFSFVDKDCGLGAVDEDLMPEGAVALPKGSTCERWDGVRGESSAVPRDREQIRIYSSVMPPAFYAFIVRVINPAAGGVVTADPTTACGYSSCWDFATHSHVTGTGDQAPTSAVGFPINTRMPGAQVLKFETRADYIRGLATGRDDRPLRINQITIKFRLDQHAQNLTDMIITAPIGYEFDADCLSGMAVRPTEVFGTTLLLWPTEFAEWPTYALLTKCRGTNNVAVLTIEPTETSFLQSAKDYVLRMKIKNPAATPPADKNYWRLEYNGETATKTDYMSGFALWPFTWNKFTSTSTTSTTTATKNSTNSTNNSDEVEMSITIISTTTSGSTITTSSTNTGTTTITRTITSPPVFETSTSISMPTVIVLAGKTSVQKMALGTSLALGIHKAACEAVLDMFFSLDDCLRGRVGRDGVTATMMMQIDRALVPEEAAQPSYPYTMGRRRASTPEDGFFFRAAGLRILSSSGSGSVSAGAGGGGAVTLHNSGDFTMSALTAEVAQAAKATMETGITAEKVKLSTTSAIVAAADDIGGDVAEIIEAIEAAEVAMETAEVEVVVTSWAGSDGR